MILEAQSRFKTSTEMDNDSINFLKVDELLQQIN